VGVDEPLPFPGAHIALVERRHDAPVDGFFSTLLPLASPHCLGRGFVGGWLWRRRFLHCVGLWLLRTWFGTLRLRFVREVWLSGWLLR
jgi:hypothetical protein